jgi:hypothetical protein
MKGKFIEKRVRVISDFTVKKCCCNPHSQTIISKFNYHIPAFLTFPTSTTLQFQASGVLNSYINGENKIRACLRKQEIFIHQRSAGIVSIRISG